MAVERPKAVDIEVGGMCVWNSCIGEGAPAVDGDAAAAQKLIADFTKGKDVFVHGNAAQGLKGIEKPARAAENRPPAASARSRFFA